MLGTRRVTWNKVPTDDPSGKSNAGSARELKAVPRQYWKELFRYHDGQVQSQEITDDRLVTSST